MTGLSEAVRSQLDRAYDQLTAADDVFASLVEVYGREYPFEWHDGGRTSGSNFAAMVLHIIGQQISAVVAFRVFDRVCAAAGGPLTAAAVAALGHQTLRGCGLSNAKADYVLGLAQAEVTGQIALEHLGAVDDATVLASLTAIRGIGVWSAQTFLLHNLRRPDIFPAGDLGIRRGIREQWHLDRLPLPREAEQRGAAWAPWRSYAAALLWRSLRPPTEPSDPKARALAAEAERAA